MFMIAKFLIFVFLLAILVALFTGMVFLIKDPSTLKNRRTMKALTWRVILQLGLIAFLVFSYFMGWIHPHGLVG